MIWIMNWIAAYDNVFDTDDNLRGSYYMALKE